MKKFISIFTAAFVISMAIFVTFYFTYQVIQNQRWLTLENQEKRLNVKDLDEYQPKMTFKYYRSNNGYGYMFLYNQNTDKYKLIYCSKVGW